MSSEVRLTRQMVLEIRDNLPDGSGGFSVSWVELGRIWAQVLPRSGREDFVAGRPVSRAGYRITVRAAPEGSPSRPRPDQRLREGERVFNILSVAERDASGRYLELFAEEGVKP